MTKNRARKKATRQLAAETGTSYTQAARTISRADFTPFLEQITGCWCDTCATVQAGGHPSLLLDELEAGTHHFRTRDQYEAQESASSC